jgi:1-acyl-sn-glycerol-3-phosphate acyltransferase
MPDAVTAPEPFTRTYRVAMAVCVPIVSLWGRLEVEGLEALPQGGPVLVVANHDSQTDPLAVGVAARKRRQIRALAKRSLWDKPGLGRILDGMGQIPIERAAGDAGALVNAVAALRDGACIGVFPEGTISVGRRLRARSGIGRLALEVPEARLVCVAVYGTPALARFPKRPRIRVRFFEPASGQTNASETAAALAQRLLDEIRAIAPPVDAGRDPAKTLEKYERKLAERESAAAKRRAETGDRERV